MWLCDDLTGNFHFPTSSELLPWPEQLHCPAVPSILEKPYKIRMTSGISTITDNLPENLSRVYKICDKMKRALRSVYEGTLAMQVAGQIAPRRSPVGGAYDHDGISFSPLVLRWLLHICRLNCSACAICRTSNTSRACHKNAPDLRLWLFYASFSANPTARSSFASLPTAKSLPTQYSPIPGARRRSPIKN